MNAPSATVNRIHFEDFDGRQFERLVLAYHLRSENWKSLEWYGQIGSDLGRDILGVRLNASGGLETVCIQCANRKTIPATKANRDIDKVLASPHGKPDIFRLVGAAPISAKVRDKIKAHAKAAGISSCEIWSGEEFEERLRASAESILKRFLQGELFPDAPSQLRQLNEAAERLDDDDALASLSRALDRPVFRTPFHSESSLPGFKQAITDTIQALNTGIWQTRDGKEIARLPSRHSFRNPKTRESLARVESDLVKLRSRFDELLKSNAIKHCGCNVPDCPVFFFTPDAAREMDTLRCALLRRFQQIDPRFSAEFGWDEP